MRTYRYNQIEKKRTKQKSLLSLNTLQTLPPTNETTPILFRINFTLSIKSSPFNLFRYFFYDLPFNMLESLIVSFECTRAQLILLTFKNNSTSLFLANSSLRKYFDYKRLLFLFINPFSSLIARNNRRSTIITYSSFTLAIISVHLIFLVFSFVHVQYLLNLSYIYSMSKEPE